jgi:PAS domain S-box-containing protein
MIAKDDEDQLLRSALLQTANSVLIARRRGERQREAYLAEAQRLSHTGSLGWRPSTGEIHWSEETFRIFEYDRTTKPTVDLVRQRVHPEDAALVKQTVDRATQDGKDFDHEFRLLMPDGSVKYVRLVAHAMSDESGSIEFVGAVMDVTAAKKAEGRILQIIDTIPAYAWTIVPDGTVDFVNHRFVEFTGRSIEELLGSGWASTLHPDDLPRQLDTWRAALAAGEPMESEVRVRGRDGDYRWSLIRNVPLRDELGKIVKWYGTAIEIEDRKRAEVLLAGEKRILEMIAKGDSRARILEGACRLVEKLDGGSLCSILLLDPGANCLRHGAAPNLPIAYTEAIDGAVIGPSVGSCGTAAYHAKTVIVSDIATDPLWRDFRDLASAHGLRACWSTPILSSAGRVLGTFATYYREPRSPSPQELNVMERVTHLASIAIEREQAEETLRESEAYLAEAQRLTHTASFVVDVATRKILHWSQEAFRLFGFDPEDGVPSSEVGLQRLHPEDLEAYEKIHESAIRERTDYEVDCRIVLPNGTMKYIHEIGHPVFNEAGDLIEYMGTVMDVTERKRTDEERERLLVREQTVRGEAVAAQQRFRDLVNSVEGIVWEADVPSFQFTFISKQAERVLGYPVERWLSEPTFWTDHVHSEDRQWTLQYCQEATAAKRDHEFEYRMIAADGRVVWLRDMVTVVVEGDRVTRVRGVMVDLTNRKQAEEALHQAQADLAHVTRVTTMGELTASLAHEVNQPIAAAITNANTCLRWLARDNPDLAEAREAASRIVKSATRAAEIIGRIRLLFEKGAQQRELVDLNEVIREMTVLLRGESARYSICLRAELATDLPQAMADRVQLQQVLMNLMINSIDAMKGVDGTRDLIIRSQRSEKEQLLVSVSDTGVGLPPKQADQIFNAFFTTKSHGTGMGLRISRSIVESHGGRLWAADNSPSGACFYFTLPTTTSTVGS